MSLTEILDEIPKLSFAERQKIIHRTLEIEENDLSPEEKQILDQRVAEFRRDPDSGVTADQLKSELSRRLRTR